jgi:hypothetical protein
MLLVIDTYPKSFILVFLIFINLDVVEKTTEIVCASGVE